ncbi:zinc finger HIT domain-containing protein 2 [Phoenix dactylifera]|uniref:Zinc finger HIT domain-containing protein 2 n=1 Tax=Phoenix dactylifera TaxID=42345 RepID=A0A8B7CUQ7_PHODC|nr:zinc finger HIT domain-containing protein 2 [Phoenix dactylifera]XP_026665180.2 zinc finger HIT domain-containing protein 2 [Phoenix dactylifera]
MEDVVISEATPSTSSSLSDARIVCRVCQKQFAQYTCPRCNSRYCSLPCYKRHSLQCTESFMRENVMEELQQIQPEDETKTKMLDILKRFHSEEEMNSDDEDESMLSEETIQKVVSGNEIRLEDLSADEIKHFRKALASGELSRLIEPWTPWWTKPSARSISLSPEGSQLVKPLHEHEGTIAQLSTTPEPNLREVPAGPENPLPPLRQLTHTDPSPLLAVHLVDVLYSYCFTLRLYNGDWHSDPFGAATTILSVSKVLGDDARPETVAEALGACLEQTCSAVYRHTGGFRFRIGLLDDIISLLHLGCSALICSLCDLQRLIQAGERMLKSEKMGKAERSKSSRKLHSAERKVYFLMCWVHDQPGEAWSSLAGIVEVEKASLSESGYRGKPVKGERKAMPHIEEV